MGTGGPDVPVVGSLGYGVLERGIVFRFWGQAKDFLLSKPSGLVMRPTEPLTVGTGAVQLPPSIANVGWYSSLRLL